MARRRAFFAAVVAALYVVSGAGRAASFDAASLRFIPRQDVVDLATVRFKFADVADDAHRDETLKSLALLDDRTQTFVWLVLFDDNLSVPSDQPTQFIGTDRFLPRMVQALREAGSGDAGLAAQAELFAAAKAEPTMPGVDTGSIRFVTIKPGPGFGPKAEIERLVLAYADRNRTVAGWLEQAHASFGEQERVSALITMLKRIPNFYLASVHDGWPAPYRALILAEIFEAEHFNGGVEQFFSNPSGDLAEGTATALRTVGLTGHAALVEKGISLFPKPYPADRETRSGLLQSGDDASALDRALDALTEKPMISQPLAAMAAYAAREGILPR